MTPETLRRWEAQGKIEVERTPKGHRRYYLARLHHVAPRGWPRAAVPRWLMHGSPATTRRKTEGAGGAAGVLCAATVDLRGY